VAYTQEEAYRWVTSPAYRVLIELQRVEGLMIGIIGRNLRKWGLTVPKLNILALLRYGPESGLSLGDLGNLMLVSPSNMTGLIDRLERDGLVRRSPDPHDRRSFRALITEKGKKLLEEVLPQHVAYVEDLLRSMDRGEKERLITLLSKLEQAAAKARG